MAVTSQGGGFCASLTTAADHCKFTNQNALTNGSTGGNVPS